MAFLPYPQPYVTCHTKDSDESRRSHPLSEAIFPQREEVGLTADVTVDDVHHRLRVFGQVSSVECTTD